jgi:hypothetical protein
METNNSDKPGVKTLQQVAHFEVIRGMLVESIPTGECKAWDFVLAIKKFLAWYDEYTSQFQPSTSVENAHNSSPEPFASVCAMALHLSRSDFEALKRWILSYNAHTEKPDFEALADEMYKNYYNNNEDAVRSIACQRGMDKIWNTYVLPLQSQLKSKEEELTNHFKHLCKKHDRIKELEEALNVAKDQIIYVSDTWDAATTATTLQKIELALNKLQPNGD